MFTIDETGTIHVSRGDSIGLSTQPFIETDDGIAAIPIEGDNCVIFTVKSRYSGRTIIKRILSGEDVVDALDEAIGKKANSDHTHNYAASESEGGAALRAVADENGENIAGNFSSIKSTIGDIQTVLATVVEVTEEDV